MLEIKNTNFISGCIRKRTCSHIYLGTVFILQFGRRRGTVFVVQNKSCSAKLTIIRTICQRTQRIIYHSHDTVYHSVKLNLYGHHDGRIDIAVVRLETVIVDHHRLSIARRWLFSDIVIRVLRSMSASGYHKSAKSTHIGTLRRIVLKLVVFEKVSAVLPLYFKEHRSRISVIRIIDRPQLTVSIILSDRNSRQSVLVCGIQQKLSLCKNSDGSVLLFVCLEIDYL